MSYFVTVFVLAIVAFIGHSITHDKPVKLKKFTAPSGQPRND